MSSVGRVAAGAVAGLVGVLAVEIAVAATAEYLPTDPGFTVDAVATPPGERAGARAPLRLVMLGDSTVAGVGAPDAAGALPVLVAERVALALERPVHVTGYGRSGARTRDVGVHQVPLLTPAADVVVIVIGSNDVTHVTPFWVMEERTEAMLRAAHEQADAPVVLGGIPQFATTPALAQPLRALVGAYANPLRAAQTRAAADTAGASFVDIAAQASPRFLGKPESMSRDGFHPSPIGYGFWADALAPAVVDAVREQARGARADV